MHILRCVSHRPVLRSRKRSGLPDNGQDCREGCPEVPDIYLRAVVAGKSPERQGTQTADGTASLGHVEIRSADALGFYQQGSRSHREQNVRMRDDSMMFRNMCRWCALLLVLGAL